MDFDPNLLLSAVAWFFVFLFSTTLHEAAHAWAALRLGDETAYLGGQVSLNPTPHIQREPFGMVVVPLISFFLMKGSWMIGWASAPYDPRWAQRFPKKSALMALAGPVANLLLVVVSGIGIRLALSAGYIQIDPRGSIGSFVVGTDAAGSGGVALLLAVTFGLNLVLFLFNLLPLPPMDGSAVIQLFMPEDAARRLQEILYQPMWGFVGLLVAWRFFGEVLWPVFGFAVGLIIP